MPSADLGPITTAVAPATTVPLSLRCRTVPTWSSEADVGVRRTSSAELSPARRAAQLLATALVEVLAGRRPLGQLRAHCAPPVFAGLAERTPSLPVEPLVLLSTRVCQPADGIAEASATLRSGLRARALAFRMEGVDGRWRITALDVG